MKTTIWTLCIAFVSPHSALRAAPAPLPVNVRSSLASVSANELKGDLSFLASDALQGRFTPSPGLEVAAEFIASKFRAAGLEPGGDHDYFQRAEMVERHLPALSTGLTLSLGEHKIEIAAAEMTLEASAKAAHLDNVPVLMLPSKDPAGLTGLDLTGKAVISPEPDAQGMNQEQLRVEYSKMRAFNRAVAAANALVNISILTHKHTSFSAPRLIFADQAAAAVTPLISVISEELSKLVKEAYQEQAAVSVDIPAPQDTKFVVKNVIGILRGSDPSLSKTAVLLTAHYDHIGTIETAKGMTMGTPADSTDRIYNGANDDGSGTVSVIEIARAFAKMRPRPKRSIVFMTFFGEERSELGSQFYGKHPVFPINHTVADLNLEQMGRTDATNGRQLNNASVTGFDFSNVTDFLVQAGKRVGIKVYLDAQASDAYFTRSDNDALAEQGVPAHTLCVAFDYPDYHGLGDEWPKVDYENMAKVDRMVLLALLNIANSPKAPEWNAQNEKTKPFRDAQAGTSVPGHTY